MTDSNRPLALRLSLRVDSDLRDPSVGSDQRKQGISPGRRGGALRHA